jgi:hypothetical protein
MLVGFLNWILESANGRNGRHWRRRAWMLLLYVSGLK